MIDFNWVLSKSVQVLQRCMRERDVNARSGGSYISRRYLIWYLCHAGLAVICGRTMVR